MNAPYRISSPRAEYCLGRMVGEIGIVRIGTLMSLSVAETRIKELAEVRPGRYIIFHRSTGRVIAQYS
jgi:hypothetical protein